MEPIPVIPPRPIPLNYDHELLIPPSPDDVTGHNGFLLYPTHTGIQSVGDGTGFHSITWPLDLDPFNPDAGPVDYTHTWYEYDLTPNWLIYSSPGSHPAKNSAGIIPAGRDVSPTPSPSVSIKPVATINPLGVRSYSYHV